MPAEALTTAANEMLCFGDTGMSVMEMSHRSKMYQEIFGETEALVRELMHVPMTTLCCLSRAAPPASSPAWP